jgi:hypothetical protein
VSGHPIGDSSTYLDDTLSEHQDGGWKHEFKTISVQHNKDFMRYGGKFVCKIISIAPKDETKMHTSEKAYFKNGLRVHRMHLLTPETQKCECRCDVHPTACFRKNFRISNAEYIPGNIHKNIANKDECSGMCAKHPDCTAWEYDSNTKCILKTAAKAADGTDEFPNYVANDDLSMITYAGLNSGSTGCIHKQVMCPMGKYKWLDAVTEDTYCTPCPVGTTTSGQNQMGVAMCTHGLDYLNPLTATSAA